MEASIIALLVAVIAGVAASSSESADRHTPLSTGDPATGKGDPAVAEAPFLPQVGVDHQAHGIFT